MKTTEVDLYQVARDFDERRKDCISQVVDETVRLLYQAHEEWGRQDPEMVRTDPGYWLWSKGKMLSDLIGEHHADRIQLVVARLNCETEFEHAIPNEIRGWPDNVQCWTRMERSQEFPFREKRVLIRFTEV